MKFHKCRKSSGTAPTNRVRRKLKRSLKFISKQTNFTTQPNNSTKQLKEILTNREWMHSRFGMNFHKCRKSSGRASTNRVHTKLKSGFKYYCIGKIQYFIFYEFHNFSCFLTFDDFLCTLPLKSAKTWFSKCSYVRNNWKTRTFPTFRTFHNNELQLN